MTHLVGSTRDQVAVYVDLATSNAAKQISRYPHLLTLADEVLKQAVLKGARPTVTYDMGRIIGYNFVIEVDHDDAVFYAQMAKEAVYTPFTKKGDPKSTQLLTMALVYDKPTNSYDLRDIWLGAFRPARPGDEAESDESKAYWEAHAHVYCDQPLRPTTITHDCPY